MANLHKACGSIQKCRIAITSQTVATVQKLLGVGKKRATMVIFHDFQISCPCFGFDLLFQIGLFVETKKFNEGLSPDLQLGRSKASDVQHSPAKKILHCHHRYVEGGGFGAGAEWSGRGGGNFGCLAGLWGFDVVRCRRQNRLAWPPPAAISMHEMVCSTAGVDVMVGARAARP